MSTLVNAVASSPDGKTWLPPAATARRGVGRVECVVVDQGTGTFVVNPPQCRGLSSLGQGNNSPSVSGPRCHFGLPQPRAFQPALICRRLGRCPAGRAAPGSASARSAEGRPLRALHIPNAECARRIEARLLPGSFDRITPARAASVLLLAGIGHPRPILVREAPPFPPA